VGYAPGVNDGGMLDKAASLIAESIRLVSDAEERVRTSAELISESRELLDTFFAQRAGRTQTLAVREPVPV